jgi:hypothetical protein
MSAPLAMLGYTRRTDESNVQFCRRYVGRLFRTPSERGHLKIAFKASSIQSRRRLLLRLSLKFKSHLRHGEVEPSRRVRVCRGLMSE